METKKWLSIQILDFLTVVRNCYENTSFAEDRILYEKDLAFCVNWLILLHNNVNEKEVMLKIIDRKASKFIYDVFKSGVFGDEEATAFKNLQDKILGYIDQKNGN